MENNNDNIITKVNNDSFEEVTDNNLNEVIKGNNKKNKHNFLMKKKIWLQQQQNMNY